MLTTMAFTLNWIKEHKLFTVLIILIVLTSSTLLFSFTRRDFRILFQQQKKFTYEDTERYFLINKPNKILESIHIHNRQVIKQENLLNVFISVLLAHTRSALCFSSEVRVPPPPPSISGQR